MPGFDSNFILINKFIRYKRISKNFIDRDENLESVSAHEAYVVDKK